MMKCLRRKKDREVTDETAFLINGSMLLEKLVAFCNGRCNPIRNFSAEELEKATNNYDKKQVLKLDGYFELYKGFLQDRPVIVKKFVENQMEQFAINEIVYASGMSKHKNALKLLDCTMEFEVKIAADIANVVVYIHTAFPGLLFIETSKPQIYYWMRTM
ncbi:hypothetical protein GH714_030621 [Hevea brasiliensis]|uniref:Serine-threonine/tyrosine-protein kinase catalytic domain-containing protein n=1 Tax=Hevea brasiliensis TaxID=3981 RepID=A0A6A6LEV8_HEVBR|nr:hypothetical protein GH714_030621 [Hevea brasiliensis]